MKLVRPLILIAGLAGASGVALSALAAHRPDGANLAVAANMLLFHAPAFLALSMIVPNRLRAASAVALAIGLVLFAGDLLTRTFLGTRLFPMAAPIGGMLMIAGWLGIAISAFTQGKA